MTLSTPDRNSIIKYRRERAYSTLEEAKFNIAGKYWNLVANRLYYSVFYICIALLLSRKITANTHVGVKSQMGFVWINSPGRFPGRGNKETWAEGSEKANNYN